MFGVSVIIKALNEEKYIEAAIESALECISLVGGEVILADSGSTDLTVDIAKRFQVTIVQLANPKEASCGIGPQLGYQEAKGEFIYILDGDMELMPGFLEAALAEFNRDPSLAGIGGMLDQSGEMNAEFRLRHRMVSEVRTTGPVSHLGGGGMYRTKAVRSVGYLSNRNLHSFEELELGIRLTHEGWKLIRLPMVSIHHYPHQRGGCAQLWSRLKSHRFFGPGEVLRSSIGEQYFSRVITKFRFLYVTASWQLTLCICALIPFAWYNRLLVVIVVFSFPFVAMSLRYRDIGAGVYCIITWWFSLYGALRGFLRPQVNRRSSIDRNLIKQGEWFMPGSRIQI